MMDQNSQTACICSFRCQNKFSFLQAQNLPANDPRHCCPVCDPHGKNDRLYARPHYNHQHNNDQCHGNCTDRIYHPHHKIINTSTAISSYTAIKNTDKAVDQSSKHRNRQRYPGSIQSPDQNISAQAICSQKIRLIPHPFARLDLLTVQKHLKYFLMFCFLLPCLSQKTIIDRNRMRSRFKGPGPCSHIIFHRFQPF